MKCEMLIEENLLSFSINEECYNGIIYRTVFDLYYMYVERNRSFKKCEVMMVVSAIPLVI